ncbi:MAG: class I SAM-dependent methyltransferase [Anaerolineae bacterium]|nr:class I SAM-dependent methyltransferase [Anaerolineae bacterium]
MTSEPTRYDSTRETWENIWDGASVEIELEAVASARSMETIHKYIPFLPKDKPIIEAGSGLSAVVITLRQMGYPVYGLDYAVNALEISRRYDPSLPLIGGDVHKLPFAENSLGAYLSFGVLEHFEQGMMPALDEAYRVLQPEGVLVLTIPYPNIVNKAVAWKRRSSGKSSLTDDSFYESTYTRGALAGNVKAAGFTVEHVSPTSHAFTLRGLGGVFQSPGYYKTSALAEGMGRVVKIAAPWAFNYMTLVVARK